MYDEVIWSVYWSTGSHLRSFEKNPANSKIHQGIFLMTILCKYLNIWSLLVYINLLTRTRAITVDICKK